MNNLKSIIVSHEIIVITIPTYNEAKYIKETLISVSNQTWQNFKVLISDNYSNDETGAICEDYCRQDNRFHYFRQNTNIGAVNNFQFLLDYTESPYFMWLGAHDLLHPEFLAIHLAILEANKNITLSYSSTQFIDEDGYPQKVTNGGILADIKGTPYFRYIKSILNLGEYTPINQVIRREALKNFRFSITYAPDNMPLSRLAYLGKINRYSEPLYIARYWYHSQRQTSEMERATGDREIGIDFKYFRLAYLQDFDKLYKGSILTKVFYKGGILAMIQIRIIWHNFHYNKELPILSLIFKALRKATKVVKNNFIRTHEQ